MDASTLRAAIEAAISAPPERITVPGLGVMFVRVLSAGAMDTMAAQNHLPHRSGRYLAHVLCDSAGVLLYDTTDPKVWAMLDGLQFGATEKIVNTARRLAGQLQELPEPPPAPPADDAPPADAAPESPPPGNG